MHTPMEQCNNEIIDSLCTKLALANTHNEAMREALEKIIAYRDLVDPIHFQLEKMDHFLFQARKALALAEGKE